MLVSVRETLTVKTFIFLLLLNSAKSDVDNKTCEDDYRNLDNDAQIDVLKYCSNKLCIEKCCGKDEMIDITNKCMNKTKLFKKRSKAAYLAPRVNYSTNILSSGHGSNPSEKNFVFVKNHRDLFKCTSEPGLNVEYNILGDGSIRYQDTIGSKQWYKIERLKYCIDYKLVKNYENKPAVKIIIRLTHADPKGAKQIQIFEIGGVLISSFFLLLVLVVYCLLPDCKFADRIMMAYTFTLLSAFISKLTFTFISMQPEPPPQFCKIITPVVYFTFQSSIFWLTAYAYDAYLMFRPYHCQRESKHAQQVKFRWYSLYAWGTPLLLTAVVTTLDNLPNLDIVPPPFQQCLTSGLSFDLYYKIPIGILIIINIVLFIITLYNIINSSKKKFYDKLDNDEFVIPLIMIRYVCTKGYTKMQERAKRARDMGHLHSVSFEGDPLDLLTQPMAVRHRFVTYAKLTVMMGVFWFFEVFPPEKELWIYILVNSFNLLTGFTIFYLYVCTKDVLIKLCKKFNIQSDYIKKLESQNSTKSQYTRTTVLFSSIRSITRKISKDHCQNFELVQNPTGERVGVAGEDTVGTYMTCDGLE